MRKAELVAQAQAERERSTRQAEALRDTIAAIESSGDLAVRAALVQQLSGIHFRVSTVRDEKVAAGSSGSHAKKGL